MQFVFQQRAAHGLLHFTLALGRVFPTVEAHFLHDVVNVRDDAFNDDVRVLVLGLFEQLGECFFRQIAFFDRIALTLGFQGVLRQFEHLFQKLHTGQESLLMPLFDAFQPLA